MEALELKAAARQVTGRHVKRLRRDGLVPAVLYGRGIEPRLLQVDGKILSKVLNEAGTHSLIALQIDNGRPQMTLVRDFQRDAIKRNYTHVDFYVVKMDEKVTAQVPLVFEGVSPAVRDLNGILTQGLNELEIECLPGDLISAITVNIDNLLEFHDSITVADLQLPSTITVLSDPDSMIARIEAPRLAEELEADLAAMSAEPEVLTAAKEKEEEEE